MTFEEICGRIEEIGGERVDPEAVKGLEGVDAEMIERGDLKRGRAMRYPFRAVILN